MTAFLHSTRDPQRADEVAARPRDVRLHRPAAQRECAQSGAIRVTILDDHPLDVVGICALIEGVPSFQVTATASDIEPGMNLIRAEPPDVAVIGVPFCRLSIGGSMRLCGDPQSKTKFIVVTGRQGLASFMELVHSQAHGYLLKHSVPAELIRAIRTVLAGRTYVDPAIPGARLLHQGDVPSSDAVSKRELNVLTNNDPDWLRARARGLKELLRNITDERAVAAIHQMIDELLQKAARLERGAQ